MPEISRFFGIVIRMYFDDHGRPHFHAVYAGMKEKLGVKPSNGLAFIGRSCSRIGAAFVRSCLCCRFGPWS